jgi:hypothetical protein
VFPLGIASLETFEKLIAEECKYNNFGAFVVKFFIIFIFFMIPLF